MGGVALQRSNFLNGGTIRLACGLAGVVLIAIGSLTMRTPDFTDRVIAKLPGGIGQSAEHWFVAPMTIGIAVGILEFLFGTLLVALTLQRPGVLRLEPMTVAQDDVSPGAAAARSEWRWLSLAAVGVCAVIGLFLAGRGGWGLALAWMLALVAAGVHFGRLDRRQGTRLGGAFVGAQEICGLIICAGLAFFLIAHDLTSWRWAGTPDEVIFFEFAKQPEFGALPQRWFSENGLWGYHPVLSHYYQALFLRSLGPSLFAWRLSSVFAFLASLPFFYLWVRELWSRRVAWMATIFLATAPSVLSFAHLGYTNIQSLLFLNAALGIFAWAMRRKSALGYFLAGLAAGLGFYTFYTARMAVPLVLVLGITARALPLRGKAGMRTLALAGGFALAILPWLLTSGDSVAHMLQQTFVRTSGDATLPFAVNPQLEWWSRSGPLFDVPRQWFYTLIHPIFTIGGTSHFLTNPLLDPISSGLSWIGIWLACRGLRRDWRDRFLLIGLLLSSLLVGALSPYGRPPLTRLFFLAPFYATFAAIALEQLRLDWLGGEARRPIFATVAFVALISASVAGNVFAVQRSLRTNYHGFGEGTIAELIRVSQSMPENAQIVYVQRALTSADYSNRWFDAYGLSDRYSFFGGRNNRSKAGQPNPADSLPTLLSIQPPFVVFSDLEDPVMQRRIHAILIARFPDANWKQTDPGKPWSLPYFHVP